MICPSDFREKHICKGNIILQDLYRKVNGFCLKNDPVMDKIQRSLDKSMGEVRFWRQPAAFDEEHKIFSPGVKTKPVFCRPRMGNAAC